MMTMEHERCLPGGQETGSKQQQQAQQRPAGPISETLPIEGFYA